MHHAEEYKGRSISVETMKRQNGWIWSYQIDGGGYRQRNDRPLRNEALVVNEAISAAKAEINGTG